MLEDLHSPLQHKEISRYHFYDPPVPNGQVIKLGDRVSAAVLPCPHQTPEVVMLVRDNVRLQVTCSGTADSGHTGVESWTHINSRHCLCWIIPGIPAPAEHSPHHNRSLQEFLNNIQRWCLAIILFIYTQVVSSWHWDGSTHRFCSQVDDSTSIRKVHCTCFFLTWRHADMTCVRAQE